MSSDDDAAFVCISGIGLPMPSGGGCLHFVDFVFSAQRKRRLSGWQRYSRLDHSPTLIWEGKFLSGFDGISYCVFAFEPFSSV